MVYYYQTYDQEGKRTCGHSTGAISRTAAREYCLNLIREGRLLPEKHKVKIPTFREYAQGFWDYEKSSYIKGRKGRRDITESYLETARSCVDNQLVPAFGNMRLDRITGDDIDAWLTGFADKKLSNNYANNNLKILNVMLKFAVKEKIIKTNPCASVEKLKDEEKDIEILTPVECKAIFPRKWDTVWDSYLCCVVNKLAACTGMRFGEVLGLKSEYVYEGYVQVSRQWNIRTGYGDVKTHKPRNITIPKGVEQDLRKLIQENGEGFIFRLNKKKDKPVSRDYITKGLYKALEKINIPEGERERRGLTFHSWRHFFNTTLLMENVTDSKVMALTGHVSKGMKRRYTHFKTEEFTEVKAVQEKLLGGRNGNTAKVGNVGNGKKSDSTVKKISG
jgi:integrase